jgi:hypothetical protein
MPPDERPVAAANDRREAAEDELHDEYRSFRVERIRRPDGRYLIYYSWASLGTRAGADDV